MWEGGAGLGSGSGPPGRSSLGSQQRQPPILLDLREFLGIPRNICKPHQRGPSVGEPPKALPENLLSKGSNLLVDLLNSPGGRDSFRSGWTQGLWHVLAVYFSPSLTLPVCAGFLHALHRGAVAPVLQSPKFKSGRR